MIDRDDGIDGVTEDWKAFVEDGSGGERQMADDPQRVEARDSLLVLAELRPEGSGDAERVRVRNVSSGGLMAETRHGYAGGDRIEVTLEGLGPIAGSVAWAEAGRIGVAFDHPIDKGRARKAGRDAARPGVELFRPTPVTPRRPPLRTK